MHKGIFHPKWIYHHRPIVSSAGLGTISIDRPVSEATYDFETGTGTASYLPVYLGKARVQKLARPNNRDFVEDRVELQTFRVQFLRTDNQIMWPDPFEWHINDRLQVVQNDSDLDMEQLTLYVHGWATSTNAWGETLTCQANLKQD